MTIEIQKNDTYNNPQTFPQRGKKRSTGYDVVAVGDPRIEGTKIGDGYSRIDYIEYKTNLYIAVKKEKSLLLGSGVIETDYDVLAMPRSSISKYNLVLANCVGLIDADYRGEVLLRFKYIWQPEDLEWKVLDNASASQMIGTPNINKIYNAGDKICQLKITKIESATFTLVETLDADVSENEKSDRGTGGFGSTDSKKTLTEMYSAYAETTSQPKKTYTEVIKENKI